MDVRNERITVVGLGNSGISSAMLLCEEGAIVSVTDNGDSEIVRKNAKLLEEKYIDTEIGKHTESFLHDTELLVLSPGVEPSSLPIRYARENNIPAMSELELGFRFCKGPIAAITGTNGKSTVVSLIGHILREAGMPVNVCGNIGNSLSGEIRNINKDTVVILETSSFQLEWIATFRPKIAAILNITEDHLDRYSSFGEYRSVKERIFENQKEGDIAILNYDDKYLRSLGQSKKIRSKVLYFSAKQKVEGAYVDGNDVKLFLNHKTKYLFPLKDCGLKGRHNVENVLVSSLIATLEGVTREAIDKSVKAFIPLSHRFEEVGTVNGIEFIDDSKATNIDSTYRALQSLEKRAVLIMGGKDKNLSYEKVMPMVRKSVKKIVLIGETRSKMKAMFADIVPTEEKDTLEEAVQVAYESASPGECVLLSPMCSSFDMFKDYKHRGDVFKGAVGNLKRQNPLPKKR